MIRSLRRAASPPLIAHAPFRSLTMWSFPSRRSFVLDKVSTRQDLLAAHGFPFPFVSPVLRTVSFSFRIAVSYFVSALDPRGFLSRLFSPLEPAMPAAFCFTSNAHFSLSRPSACTLFSPSLLLSLTCPHEIAPSGLVLDSVRRIETLLLASREPLVLRSPPFGRRYVFFKGFIVPLVFHLSGHRRVLHIPLFL